MDAIKAKIFHYNIVESMNSVEDKEKREIPLDNIVVFRFDKNIPDIEVSVDRVKHVLEVRTACGVLAIHPWTTNRILIESKL
jgi:hypothetical protein